MKALSLCAATLALAAACTAVHAQAPSAFPALPAQDSATRDLTRTQASDLREKIKQVQTFRLVNATDPNDGNEILTGLRLFFDPSFKVYLIPHDNYIVIEGTPDELALAGKLIAEWDRPRHPYRLTYTITERDAGKVIGIQHVAVDLISGQRSELRNGSKIPVVAGNYKSGSSSTESQFTYLDIGLSFDATLQETASGAVLKSQVEQSEVGGESTLSNSNEPIIRQTRIEGSVLLVPGKAVSLGSLDRIGTTRHVDVEVTLEPLK